MFLPPFVSLIYLSRCLKVYSSFGFEAREKSTFDLQTRSIFKKSDDSRNRISRNVTRLTYIAFTHIARHVINHDSSIEKNLLFKRSRNFPPARHRFPSFRPFFAFHQSNQKKRKKKTREEGRKIQNVLVDVTFY